MPGPYEPEDTLVGPIIHQIATTIKQQIPAIEYVWEKMPDRAPSNNQVLLPLMKIHVLGDTNGKLKVRLTVAARHVFRRTELDAGLALAYTYLMPWLRMTAAWPNQTLGGLAIQVDPTDFIFNRSLEGGQSMIVLGADFQVLTEFNIDLI